MTTDPAMAARYCLSCRHSLNGISSTRCPECGRAFDPNDPGTTAASASRFNAEWLAWVVRILTVFWGLLFGYSFIIALLGIDPFKYLWLPGFLLAIVLVPMLLIVVGVCLIPQARLGRKARVWGVILPLLVVSVALTYWPFRITFWLHKSRLDGIADQIRDGTPPPLPQQVGLFRVYRGNNEWTRHTSLHVRGPTMGGNHLVRAEPGAADRIGMNLNWVIRLGGDWYYIEED